MHLRPLGRLAGRDFPAPGIPQRRLGVAAVGPGCAVAARGAGSPCREEAMTLLYPIWLILAVPLAVTLLLWPLPGRLLRILRGASLLLVLLAMCWLALRLP